MKLPLWCALALAIPCCAQKVYVYSPLTRVDPTGAIVKADRGQSEPRTILSPGIPRNAVSSLRVIVEMDKPGPYLLDIGQNPENAVQATLYKEVFVETPQGWIPDGLQKVAIPYRGLPTDFRLPGQRVVTFWLDMWVDRKAVVDRIKIEPQLWIEMLQDWAIYPMEVRVQAPMVPNLKPTYTSALPAVTAPADAAVRGVVRAAVCGGPPEPSAPEPQQFTARDLLRRNAEQHMLLLKDQAQLKALLDKTTGNPKWCESPSTPPAGSEWYLRFRDQIYRTAGARD